MNKVAQARHFSMLVWAIGVFALMSLGLTPNFPSLPTGGDKILHASAFFALVIGPALFMPRMGMVVLSALFLVLCGALLEILQGFVSGRESSLTDLFADVIGVAAGLWLGYLLRKAEASVFLPVKERSCVKRGVN